jgi:tRNA (guanine-N7-)-methyltransferase
MAINNPYIDKVKEHKNILNITDDIYENKWKWDNYFWNNNDLVLEIGTGLWNFFSKEVSKNPDNNFLWMEIKYKRLYISAEKALWNLNNYVNNWIRLRNIEDKINKNLEEKSSTEGFNPLNFVLLKDFWENINKIFKENEISKSYIFFPDPWAKKKKWLKNRLLQTEFLNKLLYITKTWWKSIIKTDHFWYYEFVLEELKKTSWKIIKISTDFENDDDFKNEETTEFQQLFRWQNIKINYIELQK